VVLQKGSADDQFADVAAGSLVRLTGVCVSQFDSEGKAQSFRLMLRSAADINVLSRPAWWTVRRTLWALGGLAAVLLLALGWVTALRREVRQRTKELNQEIDHHKRTEEQLKAEIAERKRMESEVEHSHQELLIASRQAGMAEVATSVLHNVGNVLNSVNVSASLIVDKIRKSKVVNISRAADMINEHALDLAHFLEQDPKGRQLPQYLGRLAKHLEAEQTSILSELESLRKNVEHIKGIVGMQQNYAKVFGSAEPVKPAELVEDALRMNSGALVRHEVHVVREYEPNVPEITVDKHKLLQILVNLICNAKKACDESIYPEKLLTVRVINGDGSIKISVIDNGVGIKAENLTRIFNHGFTTRKDGHGFGLHSGALAAKEMGGALVVQSDGPGKGAVFTVELPVQPK
jgi:signal transduction histidine kinase